MQDLGSIGIMSDSLLAIHVIGSRANGTSDTSSDLDFAVLRFPYDDIQNTISEVREVAGDYDLEVDSGMAAVAVGLHDVIPDTAPDLIRMVDSAPHHAASIFEDGIYTSSELIITRLAVTSILHAYATKKEAEERWHEIRDTHAEIYMGDLARMQEKLIQRLNVDDAAVKSHIPQNLMNERKAKFGLPSDLGAYHSELKDWAVTHRASLMDTTGWELYEDVGSEL